MRYVTAETDRFQLFRTAATVFPEDDILFLRDDTRETWYLAKADALAAALSAFVTGRGYASVCAFGSSSGGFAVLTYAARLPGFKAGVILVPQACMWELQRKTVIFPDCCSLLAPPLNTLYPARFDLLAPLHCLPAELPAGCILWSFNEDSPTDARLARHAHRCLDRCGPRQGGFGSSALAFAVKRAVAAASRRPLRGCPPAVVFAPFSAPGLQHAPSIAERATADWFEAVVRPHFDKFCEQQPLQQPQAQPQQQQPQQQL